MSKRFKYPCVVVRQSSGGRDILLFSAAATEIDDWVGIPQRLSLSGAETAGFQRTVSPAREKQLRKFFAEPQNVIQNPLLCAIRQAPGVRVTYQPSEADPNIGHVAVEVPDFALMTMQQLLQAARGYLEARVPALAERPLPSEIILELQNSMNAGDLGATEETYSEDEGETSEDDQAPAEPAEEALFDESQITSFWDQLRAREELAGKLSAEEVGENLAGFSREMLTSYLRPVILVDGQHRLRGAILAARDIANHSNEAENLVTQGMGADEARVSITEKVVRTLPISLLMDDSPAEHVFQYVLVNQKATPVPKALLGTIISTSLAKDELQGIADRLEDAKIQLEGSRIISILTRAEDSPFAGLVAKGFGPDDASKLQWNVVGSLSDIFRYLKGARHYHESTDHAAIWSQLHLATSPIVADWQAKEFESPKAYWQDLNGPWIDVFKVFWTKVREKLASEDPNAPNHWGSNATSNIFNKPMLHVLAADFFAYLKESKTKIGSKDDIPGIVDDWLEFAKTPFFSRDWRLEGAGVKKDSVGTRRQWSKLWANYRQTGNAPKVEEYIKLLRS